MLCGAAEITCCQSWPGKAQQKAAFGHPLAQRGLFGLGQMCDIGQHDQIGLGGQERCQVTSQQLCAWSIGFGNEMQRRKQLQPLAVGPFRDQCNFAPQQAVAGQADRTG